jgi:hypothetical protein
MRRSLCLFLRTSPAVAWTRNRGGSYDVAPDWRFLINAGLDSATAPITLLMNWTPNAAMK